MVRLKIAFLFLIVVVSCNDKKQDILKIANDFADIECRAMALREKRFALANQIRFTQDTLLNFSDKNDTARLKSRLQTLNGEKETILQTSLILADSIKHRLDSLMQHHLTTAEDKTRFDEQLKSALEKKGCTEKL